MFQDDNTIPLLLTIATALVALFVVIHIVKVYEAKNDVRSYTEMSCVEGEQTGEHLVRINCVFSVKDISRKAILYKTFFKEK